MYRVYLTIPSVLIIVTALGACGNTAGVQEMQLYVQSVDRLVAASEPLVDRLAVAEREAAIVLIDQDGQTVNYANAGPPFRNLAPTLAVEHAAYFAQSGRPPFAGSVEAALGSLSDFNAIILIYANGEALSTAKGDVEALSGSLTRIAEVARLGIPGVGTATKALLEGASLAGDFGSRSAFRTILREEGDRVDALLLALQNAAPIFYGTLVENLTERRETAALEDQAAFDALTEQIKTDRAVVSEWVLLLETARTALASTQSAIDTPRSLGRALSESVALSSRVEEHARSIRTLLAGG